MNKKLKIVLILVVILLIPLCINSLILRPAIFNFIGEGTDWLLFWGSYLGGVFAAVIGFVTLYYSAKRQNIEMQISHKENSLRILQAKLSECVSIFNYSRMLSISLYIDQPEKYDQILDELLKYQEQDIDKAMLRKLNKNLSFYRRLLVKDNKKKSIYNRCVIQKVYDICKTCNW